MSEESLVRNAHQLKKAGKFAEAAELYYALTKNHPYLDWAYTNLGEILANQGHFDRAVEEFHKAIELNPNYAWHYYKLGQVLVRQKKEEEAIIYLRKAISLKPERYKLYKLLGEILLQKGNLEEAVIELEKAAEANPRTSEKDTQILRELNFKLKLGGSISYWENRYKKGGHSGSGSFKNLAKYKASVLNNLVARENINTIVDFGCGDGNQLRLADYPNYIGLDVSPTAIVKCHKTFKEDPTKSFFLYNPLSFFDSSHFFTADLTMSIDVLYHLIEDEIYVKYLNDLFGCAKKMVAIYSWNFSEYQDKLAMHIRPRNFTKDIDRHIQGWRLKEKINNPYSVKKYGTKDGSYSNFYIYCKNQ